MKTISKLRTFHNAKGPSIIARFSIKNGVINHVDLELNKKRGFSWSVSGDDSLDDPLNAWIASYCSGKEPTIALPLCIEEIPAYSRKVLRALRKISLGNTTTYQQLAQATGNPRAARAVGNACGRNPVPLLIPCHRVLAAKGRLGGFSQGIDIKQCLLSFEMQ